jgi:hypothetical protein
MLNQDLGPDFLEGLRESFTHPFLFEEFPHFLFGGVVLTQDLPDENRDALARTLRAEAGLGLSPGSGSASGVHRSGPPRRPFGDGGPPEPRRRLVRHPLHPRQSTRQGLP